jgi:2-polyprenyl-3-methyl-5-hydroxy-6-metoxy-1,4-benzoquinol methylase
VAEHRRGHGTGHLRRCAELVSALNGTVDWLLPSQLGEGWYSREEAWGFLENATALPVRWVDEPEGPYDRVIVDRRSMDLEEIMNLHVRGILVAIDAAGDLRRYASYVLDILPPAPGSPPPNVSERRFLPVPTNRRQSWPSRLRKILVVYGGEDNEQKTYSTARALVPLGLAVDIVTAGESSPDIPCGRISGSPGLRERLYQYDLIVTHFGLLAFEAISAHVPVVLMNPTRYHESLSRTAGFPTVKTYRELIRRLRDENRVLLSCRALYRNTFGESVGVTGSPSSLMLANYLKTLEVPARLTSPGGGTRWEPAVERFPDRTYFRNRSDGIVFMQSFRAAKTRYDESYFFDEYRHQYGRTYLEDFDSIASTGHRRMRDIRRQTRRSRPFEESAPRLLDLGCAYGPFLLAASREGCNVTGYEINAEAVCYVRDELDLDAVHGDLRDLSREQFPDRFDIVTMWYVIEHVVMLDSLLTTVADLLRPGGLLAFSTPHGAGISARRSRREFLERSPLDHYSVWSIPAARRLLRGYGFRVRHVRVTGHHAERFPGPPPVMMHPVVGVISRLLRLGDTFEIIAERL